MFTYLGKALVFALLVFGVGVGVFATAAYTQRPTWFMEPPEGGIEKGHSPVYFKQLKTEIDTLGNAAVAASATWGANLRRVEAAEKLRADRAALMFGTKNPDGSVKTKGLLDFAREGNPGPGEPAADAAGFYHFKEDPATKLLDLTERSDVVKGPDGRPLRGTDRLLDRVTADAKAAEESAQMSLKLRRQLKVLGDEIGLVDTQVAKQRTIRDHLLNEAAYLAAFEVNVTEQRATAGRRRAQLEAELKKFGVAPGKNP